MNPCVYALLRPVTLFVVLAAFFSAPLPAQAQAPATHCLLLPLAPAERAQQAQLIVEAEVLDARSFWDAGHRRLFTRHRLRVFSLFKGRLADTTGLQLITEGGRLGFDQQTLTNTLHLEPSQQGVFLLTKAPWAGLPPTGGGQPWAAFGSEQGFIEYHLADNTATEPFRRYPAINAAFYQQLSQLTGQPRRVVALNQALHAAQVRLAQPPDSRRTQAPSINALAPSQLPAGVGAVLTITGTEFGASRGTGFVEFKNADDGGATWVKARETDYVSWTATQIQVRVPSSGDGRKPAGSGRVRVSTGSQLQAESPDELSIVYALTNVESTDGTALVRPNHVARNDSGGVSFRFGSTFQGGPAAAAWRRALATWRCHTGMNWRVGAASATNAIADDDQNIIAFDNAGDQLPAQVLGRTTTYYRGCFDASRQVVFWVKEIDMQFDNAANFQFGPDLASGMLQQVDFESVVLHELGHAHQLGHLIQLGAVMHYAVQPGRNTRSLNPMSDVAGGRKVLRERSFQRQGCGAPALLPAPLTAFSARFGGGAVALAWASRDECFLEGFVVSRSLRSDTTAWEEAGRLVAGQGGTYQFADPQPRPGLHFYRLGLRRSDGSIDYTEALPVTTEGETPDFVIFPNPVTGSRLQLQYPATAAGAIVFEIIDELGRRHRRSQGAAQAGLNVLSVEVDGLGAGFYVLRWRDAQGREGSRSFVRL